ncbi:helix-turn-helix domain-containing protein [Rubrivirga marina]|uniref:Helix-turn-helix domain-containing protein n=1 Tax=Rubrivirga marina TaxID=1196024 RepID=A0A271IW00_9BACT|nr:helix-turn-helix domain-containing protein [Rubrivirga marina]PAP75290.1 hypothetical protein BSZ37_01945 [Rubrivirga marina]
MTDFAGVIQELVRTTSEQVAERTARRLLNELVPHLRRSPGRPSIGFLTNREAQAALGVSKATLARWRKDGTLAHSKVGQNVYYAIADVEGLLASRRVRREG